VVLDSVVFDLDACRALLGLSETQVKERLQIHGDEARRGVRYEGLEGLSQYYNPDVFPARVYVRAARVQMVYVPSGPALRDVTREELEAQIGSEPTPLRSRAGKEYVHYAHPEQGVAYSSEGDEVRFVEVFPPRSLDAYRAEIYRDPGPFII
jgi:hypothetical protein